MQQLRTGNSQILGQVVEAIGKRKDRTEFPMEIAIGSMEQSSQFTGIIRDITRRKELELEIVDIASHEQRRIGQDLHDTVSQELTALGIQLSMVSEFLHHNTGKAEELIGKMNQGLHRAHDHLRDIMQGLVPVAIDSEGLMAALENLAEMTQSNHPLTCLFSCPIPLSIPDNSVATHLYLIAQEAVHNAIKHSRPRSILISLSDGDLLTLSVEDDGTPLRKDNQITGRKGGLGLRIMRSRAAIIGASLKIEAVTPTGTRVVCTLPRKTNGKKEINKKGTDPDRG